MLGKIEPKTLFQETIFSPQQMHCSLDCFLPLSVLLASLEVFLFVFCLVGFWFGLVWFGWRGQRVWSENYS